MRIVELSFNEFLAARDQWNEAVQESIDDNVFLTWEWITNWWTHFGNERRFLVVAIEDEDKIEAAAPFMCTNYGLPRLKMTKAELIGGYVEGAVSDYHSFLIAQRRPEWTKAIIDHLASRADWIELDAVPESSQTASILRTVSTRGLRFKEEFEEECQYVPVPARWEEYLSALNKNFRRRLLRYERNLKKDFEVEFRVFDGTGSIDQAMNIFFDLNQQRATARHERGVFSDRRLREFHLDLATLFASRGWLNLAFLLLNGEYVAASYAFTYANRLYGYLNGFAPQYSKYGVGSVLIMYLMRHAINQGLSEFDFLSGDEPYKRKWNTSVRRIVTFTATERGAVHALARWVHRKRENFSL